MDFYKDFMEKQQRTFLRLIAVLCGLLIGLIVSYFITEDEEKASSFQYLNNNTIQINDTLFVTMPDGDTAKFIIKRYPDGE